MLVIVTDECYRMLRANGFIAPSDTQFPSGEWLVLLEHKTISRLWPHAFPNENISDTIMRLGATVN